jgi:zinc D-Ala-D-Ala carboxypeptidase
MEVYPKDSTDQLSEHFNQKELACKCTRPECDFTIVHMELINRLETLRTLVGHPVIITSGYRCERYQAVLAAAGFQTAKGISTHTEGMAADIKVRHLSGEDLEKLAREAGFESVGVAKTWIHVDIRPGHRRWTY